MVKVLVLYDEEPDSQQYEAHAELCRRVPGGTFRHGKVFGSPFGDPTHRYLAEWEFPDQDSFKAATRSEEFAATATDARERGLPRPNVQFVSVN